MLPSPHDKAHETVVAFGGDVPVGSRVMFFGAYGAGDRSAMQ
jgi:hypothetical protein